MMNKEDKYWIVENGRKVTSVEILSVSGNLILIKTENDKVLRLPKHRLFDSEEKAIKSLPKNKIAQKRKTPYDYMM